MNGQKAFQEYYSDEVSYCYGCGRLNEQGLQLKSYWDGEEAVCTYRPLAHQIAVPGYVYGGLIASIIDCHSTGTAAAGAYRAENRAMDTEPPLRYVTASLHVDYLRPTPIDSELVVRARVDEISGRKVTVSSELTAGGQLCARGKAILVQMPEEWLAED
jgi:acyl-coenzyme A thioesterase PaaI-like protein